MKVLIVEDDADNAAFIVTGLITFGHGADWAATGTHGLDRAMSERYDAIVLDRMLPQLDGLGVVKAVRRAGIVTPVLFLTTLSDIDSRMSRVSGIMAAIRPMTPMWSINSTANGGRRTRAPMRSAKIMT